jgi:enterobactin synthetase component D
VAADAPSRWRLIADAPDQRVAVTAEALSLPLLAGMPSSIRAIRFALAAADDGVRASWALDVPEFLARAVPRRRATFLAGRFCATAALEAAGYAATHPVLSRDSDGAPHWPEGFVGSIAHTDGESVAVATRREVTALIGVDVERVMAHETAVRIGARVAPELTGIDRSTADRLSPDLATTLAFSAKETLYKCLYPRVQRFFGFEAAEVEAIEPDGTVWLRLREMLHPTLPVGRRFAVSSTVLDAVVVTGLAVGRE